MLKIKSEINDYFRIMISKRSKFARNRRLVEEFFKVESVNSS